MFDGGGDFWEGDREFFGELGEVVAGDEFEVFIDDGGFEGISEAEVVELEEKAFAKVVGGDADGVEGLHDGEGIVEASKGDLERGGEGFEGGIEVSVVGEISDDDLAIGEGFGGEPGEEELLVEVFLEGFGRDDGVVKVFASFGGILGEGFVLAFEDGEVAEVVVVAFLPIVEGVGVGVLRVEEFVE